mgnify:CR=1 FL=1
MEEWIRLLITKAQQELTDDLADEMIHKDISRLQKMQYPVYDGADNALTIQRPPIVAVRLGNLIRDGNSGPLICAMNGFAFTPLAGFTPKDSPLIRFGAEELTTAGSQNDIISFTEYNYKFDFTVLHQSPMGFENQTDPSSRVFDPDSIEYVDRNTQFLGGYATGPRKTNPVGVQPVYSSDASSNNVQTATDINNLFKKLGF